MCSRARCSRRPGSRLQAGAPGLRCDRGAGDRESPSFRVVVATWQCVAAGAAGHQEPEALALPGAAECFALLGPALREEVAPEIQRLLGRPAGAAEFVDKMLSALAAKLHASLGPPLLE